MKKQQSRRDFTKSITGALASVPFLSSIVKAQQEIANTPQGIQLALPWAPVSPAVQKSDHIPPTVLGDWGSFFIEDKFKIEHRRTENGADRPEIYSAANDSEHQYGDIARVLVLTEFENVFSYYLYTFPQGFNAQLRIWLQDDPEAGAPAGTDKPQILLRGNFELTSSSPRTLVLEMMTKKLDENPKQIKKKERGWKHEHKDNANRFRIGKWQLTRPSGTQVFEGVTYTTGATGYKFMVSYYEPPARR